MAGDQTFKLIAGSIPLDFANTLDNRYDPPNTVDLLTTYDDFLRFCEQSQILGKRQLKILASRADREKTAALQKAKLLREAIERAFSSLARGRTIAEEDIILLNASLRNALLHRKLVQSNAGCDWGWDSIESDALGPLWPIAFAAAELLASESARFVSNCQAETCRWLFLDLSKNHSRRWCDMKLCGNRTKARRYYQKQS